MPRLTQKASKQSANRVYPSKKNLYFNLVFNFVIFQISINEVIARKNNITLVESLIERKNTGFKASAVLNIILGTHIKKGKW